MATDSLTPVLIASQKAKLNEEIENVGLAVALTAKHLCTTALKLVITPQRSALDFSPRVPGIEVFVQCDFKYILYVSYFSDL